MDKFKSNFKNESPEANDHLTGISGEELSVEEAELAAKDTAKADAILADIESALEQPESEENK